MIDPIIGGALIGAGGTIGSTLLGGLFGSSASDAMSEAAELAQWKEWRMYKESRKDLAPYREAAQQALTTLLGGYTGAAPRREDFLIPTSTTSATPPEEPLQNLHPRVRMAYPEWQQWKQEYDAWRPGEPVTTYEFDQEGYNKALADYESTYTPGILTAGPGEFTEDPGYQFRLSEGIKALERTAAARGRQLSGAQMKGVTRYAQDYASNEYQNFLNRWYRSMDPYFQLAGLGQGPGMASAQQAIGVGQSLGNLNLLQGQAQASNYLTQGQLWGNALGNIAQNFMTQQMLQPQTQNALTQLTPNQVGIQTGAPAQIPYNILA